MFIYAIGYRSFSKIGISIDPHRRIQEVQTGCPAKVRLFHAHAVPANMARAIEAGLHRSLADRHMHGEWFRLNPVEAITAIDGAITAAGLPTGPDMVTSYLSRLPFNRPGPAA